jgi:hypothetical protein
MKHTFKVLLALGALLLINPSSIRADSATFSAASVVAVSIRPLPPGITFESQGSPSLPTPSPVQTGSGVVTMFPRASQSTSSNPLTLTLTFHQIAGQAGPQAGLASVTQMAISSNLSFTNSTNHEITITFDYNVTTQLTTTVVGLGAAQAAFEFSITGDGATIFSDHFSTHGNEPPFVLSRGGGPFSFSIPAHGSGVISLSGTQSGLAEVPEPTTVLLLGTGFAAVALKLRKRNTTS